MLGSGDECPRGIPVTTAGRDHQENTHADHQEHWHGAASDRFLTHCAMLEVDADGNSATWGEHVTDDEYGQQPG